MKSFFESLFLVRNYLKAKHFHNRKEKLHTVKKKVRTENEKCSFKMKCMKEIILHITSYA